MCIRDRGGTGGAPAGLCGPFGGGVLLLDLLFLLPAGQRVAAVSYTHLDVYKRQVLGRGGLALLDGGTGNRQRLALG